MPRKLTSQSMDVAEDIYEAQQIGKNVHYTKWLWSWIMLIIENIPEWKIRGMSI